MAEHQKRSADDLKKRESQEKETLRVSLVFFLFCSLKSKRKIKGEEVLNLGQKTIEKPAGNPSVIPLIPLVIMRHVATLREAPPLSIKCGTKPQESQENFSSSVIVMTRHRRPQNLGGN